MVTPGTTLALVLLGASAMYGLVLFAFAKARRRMPLWWFVISCMMLGIYSLAMMVVVLPQTPVTLVLASAHIGCAVSAIFIATTIRFLKIRTSAPYSTNEKLTELGLFAVAAFALTPGVIFHMGEGLRTWTVWATPYRFPHTTMMAPVVYGMITVGLFNMIRLTFKTGKPSLRVSAVCLVACGGNDMALAMGFWTFPFCAGFGALAILIAFAIDESHEWGDEALQLADLRARLEDRVEERSREIATMNKKLVQSERQAAMGLLASSVGHEINNPLTYVMTNLASMSSTKVLDQEKLDDAIEGVQRIADIVSQLRGLSRDPERNVVEIDVNEALAIAVKTVGHRLGANKKIEVQTEPKLWVQGDRGLFTQMVVNLLSNAIESIQSEAISGHIWLRAKSMDDHVIITVEDNGVGIPKDLQERLFEPFMTGRSGGLGLGLAIVQTIIEGLHGSIEFGERDRSTATDAGPTDAGPLGNGPLHCNGNQNDQAPKGSRFEVRLPQIRSIKPITPKHSGQPNAASSRQSSNSRRVLIIDDEDIILRSLEATLVKHEVTTTSDPHQGLKLLCGQPFDFILCDLIMPHLSGLDLIDESRTKNPEMEARFVLTSGGIPSEDLCKRLEASHIKFLQKPFTTGQLCEMISSTPRIKSTSPRATKKPTVAVNVANH